MTTTVVDTSFINSFTDGSISKEDVLQQFKFDSMTLYYRENYDEYKEFVKNLIKLTYVIKNNYVGLSDDNKKVVLELIETYLVYYFNYFRSIYNNINDTDAEESVFTPIEDTIDAIACFITRFHYKIKYYDLRDLPVTEFNAYISMEEGMAVNSQLVSTYHQTLNSVKPPSNGALTDEFKITRGKIHQILSLIKTGMSDEAYTVLIDVLHDDKNSNPVPLKSNSSSYSQSQLEAKKPFNSVLEEIDEERIKQINKTINDMMEPSKELVNMTPEDIKNELGDDIDMEILSYDEVENIIGERYRSVILPVLTESSVVEESIEPELTEDENVSDIFEEVSLENILKDYSNSWEYDINHILKTIVKYMDTMYQSVPEQLMNAATSEINSMLYIMSFIKSEKLV
jgi:hypothetical protein